MPVCRPACDAVRVTDFNGTDLTGSRFENVRLAGARFRHVDLGNARFDLVDLTGATIRGAAVVGHLVFATDAWVRRAVLGDPSPWHPLDLPHDEMPDLPGVPRDREVRPSLDEVLVLRADRMATAHALLADLTDDRLAELTEPVEGPGYPRSESFPVRDCLEIVVNEEWEHRLYAERDLDVL